MSDMKQGNPIRCAPSPSLDDRNTLRGRPRVGLLRTLALHLGSEAVAVRPRLITKGDVPMLAGLTAGGLVVPACLLDIMTPPAGLLATGKEQHYGEEPPHGARVPHSSRGQLLPPAIQHFAEPLDDGANLGQALLGSVHDHPDIP